MALKYNTYSEFQTWISNGCGQTITGTHSTLETAISTYITSSPTDSTAVVNYIADPVNSFHADIINFVKIEHCVDETWLTMKNDLKTKMDNEDETFWSSYVTYMEGVTTSTLKSVITTWSANTPFQMTIMTDLMYPILTAEQKTAMLPVILKHVVADCKDTVEYNAAFFKNKISTWYTAYDTYRTTYYKFFDFQNIETTRCCVLACCDTDMMNTYKSMELNSNTIKNMVNWCIEYNLITDGVPILLHAFYHYIKDVSLSYMSGLLVDYNRVAIANTLLVLGIDPNRNNGMFLTQSITKQNKTFVDLLLANNAFIRHDHVKKAAVLSDTDDNNAIFTAVTSNFDIV